MRADVRCLSVHHAYYRGSSDARFKQQQGIRSSGSVISRALSDDKAYCRRHGRMPYIVAVLGTLPDAIFGINGVFIRVSRGRTLSRYTV
ncbi:hypothetical protein Gotur_014667 [Gossypium turneri]